MKTYKYTGNFNRYAILEELLAALGEFYPPNMSPVQISRDNKNLTVIALDSINEQDIADVISAHDHNVVSETEKLAAHPDEAIDRLKQLPLWDASPAQIYTQMQGAIDGWASLADAKQSLRVWLPALVAAVVWIVGRRRNG